MRDLEKDLASQKQQVNIHKNRKDYYEYVADEAEKERKELLEEKGVLTN